MTNHPRESDAELIARTLAGDTDAFRGLVLAHEPTLSRYLRNMMGTHGDCQDTVQEAFLAAFCNLSKYDAARGAFRTWLLRIARNKALAVISKRQPLLGNSILQTSTVPAADPVSIATTNEMFERLNQALAALPVPQRSAFVLHHMEGVTYEDIGALEGIPIGTVKSRIARARQSLVSALKDDQRITS